MNPLLLIVILVVLVVLAVVLTREGKRDDEADLFSGRGGDDDLERVVPTTLAALFKRFVGDSPVGYGRLYIALEGEFYRVTRLSTGERGHYTAWLYDGSSWPVDVTDNVWFVPFPVSNTDHSSVYHGRR